jgi:hypothetical protein
MPATGLDDAARVARHLAACVAMLTHHARGGEQLRISARIACAVIDRDADSLLAHLNAELEPAPESVPAPFPATA